MSQQSDLVPLILVSNEEYWLPYVLESARGWFGKFVLYDIGSTDRTREIVHWFVDSEKHRADFFLRFMPMCDPKCQGAFRNSMISEAGSDYYLILDGDELYTDEGFGILHKETALLQQKYEEDGTLYGVVRRIEVLEGLEEAYAQDHRVSHHRIYNRRAVFGGPHPGEYPIPEQRESNQQWFNDCVCYHFHNAARSSKDQEVPKRIERRGKGTYHPGAPAPFDLFKTLPILRKQIEDFPVNPVLKKMQE